MSTTTIAVLIGLALSATFLTLAVQVRHLRRKLRTEKSMIRALMHSDGALHVDTRTGEYILPSGPEDESEVKQ
jgi:hypothetical protein